MNMNPERVNNLVHASRNYIESWAMVLHAIAGLDSNADFDCFRDEFDATPCDERRQSSTHDQCVPIPAPKSGTKALFRPGLLVIRGLPIRARSRRL